MGDVELRTHREDANAAVRRHPGRAESGKLVQPSKVPEAGRANACEDVEKGQVHGISVLRGRRQMRQGLPTHTPPTGGAAPPTGEW